MQKPRATVYWICVAFSRIADARSSAQRRFWEVVDVADVLDAFEAKRKHHKPRAVLDVESLHVSEGYYVTVTMPESEPQRIRETLKTEGEPRRWIRNESSVNPSHTYDAGPTRLKSGRRWSVRASIFPDFSTSETITRGVDHGARFLGDGFFLDSSTFCLACMSHLAFCPIVGGAKLTGNNHYLHISCVVQKAQIRIATFQTDPLPKTNRTAGRSAA